MEITYTNADIFHIIRQIFRHTFCQCRDKNLISLFYFFIDFSDQVIDLTFHRTHLNLRIQKSGRADDLLCAEHLMIRLILSRCRRDKHHLIQFVFEFIKTQRTIVLRRRQAEPIIHQCLFTALITGIHTANL